MLGVQLCFTRDLRGGPSDNARNLKRRLSDATTNTYAMSAETSIDETHKYYKVLQSFQDCPIIRIFYT